MNDELIPSANLVDMQNHERKIAALQAENERLRDVLQEIADLYPLYRCDNPDVACEIAQEALKASDE